MSFRVQLMRIYLLDQKRVVPWREYYRASDEEAMSSFASTWLGDPEQLLNAQSNMSADVVEAMVDALSRRPAAERLIFLKTLLEDEFSQKSAKEKGSILRGNLLCDLLLVAIVKTDGREYAKKLFRTLVNDPPSSDVLATAQRLISLITSSMDSIPRSLLVVFAMLKTLCNRFDMDHCPLIGGLLLLRILLPQLITPANYGLAGNKEFCGSINVVSSILQKIANHRDFTGDDSQKYNAFLSANNGAFDSFFDRISQSTAEPSSESDLSGPVSSAELKRSSVTICQCFFVSGLHFQFPKADALRDAFQGIGNPFLPISSQATSEEEDMNDICAVGRSLGEHLRQPQVETGVMIAETLSKYVFKGPSDKSRQLQPVCDKVVLVAALMRFYGCEEKEEARIILEHLVKLDILHPVILEGTSVMSIRGSSAGGTSSALPRRKSGYLYDECNNFRLNKTALVRWRAIAAGERKQSIDDAIGSWFGSSEGDVFDLSSSSFTSLRTSRPRALSTSWLT